MKLVRILLGSAGMMFFLAACASALPTTATPTPPPVPTRVPPTATVIQNTPTPAATPTLAASPTPVKAANYCIDCHTDKDSLVKNAKVVDNKPKESEGVG